MSKRAMAPAKSKQAVSLARRMAGKKGAVVQLQAEVNTQDDWDKLMTRDGLVVVDVYSGWCGPCVGMVGNLKKCKLELGGDSLHLAIAKADEIEVLKRFRNKSEPTWMFIAGGQLLNVIFGANAPKLMRMIETELKNEQKILKGEHTRKTYRFDELTPEEEARAEELAREREEEARELAARELAAKIEERDRRYSQMMPALLFESVVVFMPHTVTADACSLLADVESLLKNTGITVTESKTLEITDEIWEEITYKEHEIAKAEHVATCLSLGPSFAVLVKCNQTPPTGIQIPEELGDIEKLVWSCLHLANLKPDQLTKPHNDSLARKHAWKGKSSEENEVINGDEEVADENSKEKENIQVPAIFTPSSPYTKCAAVAHIFPARAEKIAVGEISNLPPRVTFIFETEKAEECYALAEEHGEEVLAIGFFDKADPEEGVLLAATPQQYAQVTQSSENKVVVVVAKRISEPSFSFEALGPIYMSPNENVGAQEGDKYFPPTVPQTDNEDQTVDEAEKIESAKDGALTPTTAVTDK